jgi:uncharacterized protein YjbI with pentapeptide repeats
MRRASVSLRWFAAVLAALATVATVMASNPDDVERALTTGSCKDCDLVEAHLSGIKGDNGDFSGANLLDATIYGGSLRGANLTNATLHGTNLKLVDMTGAVGAVLDQAITDWRTTCPDGTAGPCN